MYDAALGLWHSMDPLAEKYHDISPYAYCGDNPINAFDIDGKDWFRNDQTGATFWTSQNDKTINYNNQSYRNIGENYSSYNDGIRTDYHQNEITDVTEVSKAYNVEGGEYIPHEFTTDDGTKVSVSFKYMSASGGNGDKALSKDAVGLLISGINEANNAGANISSIDVSTTTTGKHSPTSNHYAKNGGRAIDIDMINGVPVKNNKSHENVNSIQNAMKDDVRLRENYGPNIQEKNGKRHPVSGHDNHIHISAQKIR